MLSRSILTVLALLLIMQAFGQKTDSIFVVPNGKHWMVMHSVRRGETLNMLARRFHVDPSVISEANGMEAQSNLKVNTLVSIPVGEANILRYKPEPGADAKPMYHKFTAEDNLMMLSKCSGVTQRTLQQWNDLRDGYVREKQVLLVGWLLYDASQVPLSGSDVEQKTVKSSSVTRPGMESTVYSMPAAPKQVQLPPVEKLYMSQTGNDSNVTTEKGMGVFYENAGTRAGKVYYAFFNDAPRGTVIKVHNPGNAKTIYVKVMGPIPPGKQYYNAIIGISASAKEELGVVEEKVWCELTYKAQ